MPADPLAPVSAGQPVPRSERTWNPILESARAFRRMKQKGQGAVNAKPEKLTPAHVITVQNITGADLGAFAVVELTDTLESLTDDYLLLSDRPAIKGITPTATDCPFAILLDPIADDALGRAVVGGCTVAKVNITDAAHEYAIPAVGDHAKFTSAATGPVRIVSRESGSSGVKYACVLVSQPQGTGSGSTDSSFYAIITAYDSTYKVASWRKVEYDANSATPGQWLTTSTTGTSNAVEIRQRIPFVVSDPGSATYLTVANHEIVWMRPTAWGLDLNSNNIQWTYTINQRANLDRPGLVYAEDQRWRGVKMIKELVASCNNESQPFTAALTDSTDFGGFKYSTLTLYNCNDATSYAQSTDTHDADASGAYGPVPSVVRLSEAKGETAKSGGTQTFSSAVMVTVSATGDAASTQGYAGILFSEGSTDTNLDPSTVSTGGFWFGTHMKRSGIYQVFNPTTGTGALPGFYYHHDHYNYFIFSIGCLHLGNPSAATGDSELTAAQPADVFDFSVEVPSSGPRFSVMRIATGYKRAIGADENVGFAKQLAFRGGLFIGSKDDPDYQDLLDRLDSIEARLDALEAGP